MVVQARSTQVYDQLSLADRCRYLAVPMSCTQIFAGASPQTTIRLNKVGAGLTQVAEAAVFEHSENERILVEQLHNIGIEVEWGLSFVSLQMDDQLVSYLLQSDGEQGIEPAAFDYVVGCHGALWM